MPSELDRQIALAAEAIRAGKLVAFPTETVYGLGADALNPAAVERIFEAKARPKTSPLIVHVTGVDQARAFAQSWPPEAGLLAQRFWPGPLTLVLPKKDVVPGIVTAGLDTVGLRAPAHPVALALIEQSRTPIAAPSANRFTHLSPTRAEHVPTALGDRVAIILDGGPSTVGIESTVVALTAAGAMILRPGTIARGELEAVIGPLSDSHPDQNPARSPGLHPRHYQPRTPLVIAPENDLPGGRGILLNMPSNPRQYAAQLYNALHQADAQGYDWIAIEPVPASPDWDGIRDRLARAATPKQSRRLWPHLD